MLLNAGVIAASAGGGTWDFSALSPSMWLEPFDNSTLFDAVSGGSMPSADGAVARVADKSINARNATQSSLSFRAIRKSEELNGLDVLRFDGNGQHYVHSVPVSDPDNIVVFAVFKAVNGMVWAHRSQTTQLIQLRCQTDTELLWQLRSSGNVLQTITGTLEANAWTIATATLDVSANLHQLRINGSSMTPNTTNFGSQNFSATVNSIGQTNISGSPTSFFVGDLAGLVLLNAAINIANIEKGEGYFAHKLGLTANLPIDHPYKTVAP